MELHDVKTQRTQLGVSQVRLANLAGVSRYRYVMWELGNGPLTAQELRLVEDALHRVTCAQIERLISLSQAAVGEPGG